MHQPVKPETCSQNKAKLRTIVIDAGHGGKDFGAAGTYSYEKNITLAIALKIANNVAAGNA